MRLFRHVVKVISLNTLFFLILLLSIELVFGGWLSRESTITMLNVRPNTIDIEPSPLYLPGMLITYSRDRYGFRSGSGDAKSIQILAIGGSTTNERYVDNADTWTTRLQRLLAQRDCPLTIANAGVDGYSTIGNIASFAQWFDHIPDLKPRFVLVYVGINDAALDPRSANFAHVQKYESRWRTFSHYVAANSALRQLYVILRGWLVARRAHVVHGEVPMTPASVWQPAALPPDFETIAANKTAAYRQRLERLNALIHDFGARPIYITQIRVDGKLVEAAWQQLAGSNGTVDTATLLAINRTTLDFCRDQGETCVDLAGKLDFAPGDYYDAVHTAPAGSARIARFLAEELPPILCPRQPGQ
jgi:lysophospholipase L1-like esterase